MRVPIQDRASVLQKARSGDPDAWHDLFCEYRDMVYRIGYRITLNREDALDVVQETFCKAFEKVDALGSDAAWLMWLRRIASNSSINRCRRKERIFRWFGQRQNEEMLAEMPGADEDVRSDAYHQELLACLQESLSELSPKQRAVASLYFEEDMSYQEIANALGVKIGSVKSHLSRAREKLQRSLARFQPEVE